MGAAVYTIAGLVQSDAQISITTGSAGGSSGGKHQHVPSAPGTAPNNMSGHLADSIQVERIDDLTARVVANAEYAAIQELGGTINHPGGQPYFIKDGEFVPVSKSSPAAARLPKTKPHAITLPERPYMRPAAQKNQKDAGRLFEEAARRALSGSSKS